MARLHVLGSGGWIPTFQRQTSCYLLETRRGIVLFDAGTGVSRLHDPAFKLLLKKHRRALVLLSHWHQDHVEGLHYLPFFMGHMEVVLAVGGTGIIGVSPEEVLARYGGEPLLPVPFSRYHECFKGGFCVKEVKPGRNTFLGEEVEALVQPHIGPSVSFRVRDVAYVTDTCARDETRELALNANLLIHDAYLDREEAEQRPELALVHGVAHEAARVALESSVGELLLAHLNPAFNQRRLDRMVVEACAVFPRSQLASDMLSLDIKNKGEPPSSAEERGEEGHAQQQTGPAGGRTRACATDGNGTDVVPTQSQS